MAHANIVDHIGSKVTVFTKDGNAAENRQLHTVDEFGIVISNQYGKQTFIPWIQVKYVDYVEVPSVPLWNDPLKGHKVYIGDSLPNQVKYESGSMGNVHTTDALTYAEGVSSLASFTTKNLSQEFEKRTGVEVFKVPPHKDYSIVIGQIRHDRTGPATILINQD
ncbi:BC1881 family protein [Paenibacillus sp. FSL K6-0108]|uniref:BC1881 family protein n=1 Tax=Paenibacillus sp. FSL K6-0108 TaxID=2921417 RepID=UPI00324B8CF3